MAGFSGVEWRRRVLSGASVIAMAAATVVGVGAGHASAATGCHPFPDVSSSNTACANITWLKSQDITKPADGLYHPTAPVNRGAMVAFLYRLVTHGAPAPRCTSRPFPDVSTSNVFCGYISWAKANGVAAGYPDGTYGPSKDVTRGAMAAYLRRIATDTPTPRCWTKPFVDVTTTETFCGVITWMKTNGITYGIGGGRYGTTLPVTRQAMASFLHRIDGLIRDSGPTVSYRTFTKTVTIPQPATKHVDDPSLAVGQSTTVQVGHPGRKVVTYRQKYLDGVKSGAPVAVSTDVTRQAEPTVIHEGTMEAAGTRDNPLPIGSEFTSGDWAVVVNSFDPDATDELLAEYPIINDPPDPGTTYALANVTVTYLGDDSGYASFIPIAYVTADGRVINEFDATILAPNDLDGELYAGGSTTGNVALQIPTGNNGLLRITPDLFGDGVFVQTT